MNTLRLGKTGLKVTPICLGMMTYGTPKWREWVLDEEASRPFIKRAVEAGINFFDTADVYSIGVSEEVTGRLLREFTKRDDVVIASKVHGVMGPGPNDRGLSRKHIMQGIDASLRRLGTDYIDLYQIHRPSPEIAIDETLGALTDLVRAGKVRYIGCTTHPAWQVMEALACSEKHVFARYVSEQPPYNLLDRRIENELVPLALRHNLALLPWSPMAQGVLGGRYKPNTAYAPDSRGARMPGTIYAERITPRGIEAGQQFSELAQQSSKTPSQLALLWCKDQPGVTAPIYGPRTLAQLQEVLPVLEMNLSADERAACDAINPPGSVIVNFHNTAAWMKMRV